MKKLNDECIALENKEELNMFLVNGKPIIDWGNYPRYFKVEDYWYDGKNYPMWKEVSVKETEV